jgi:hypothetical protein
MLPVVDKISLPQRGEGKTYLLNQSQSLKLKKQHWF